MAETNESNLCIGDLVKVPRGSIHMNDRNDWGAALVVDRDLDGWLRVRWLQPPDGLARLSDGFDRWFPPNKLVMISRACEKKQEI